MKNRTRDSTPPKDRTFTIRVDLESDKCIKAVPAFLDLLRKYNLRASFYLVMGGESGILDLVKYRGKLKSSGERKIKLWSLREKLRIAFFPQDFVRNNLGILRRIINEGHELGLHGWKHREWTRGLERIDVEHSVLKAINRYKKLFGYSPVSWTSPGFNINEKVMTILGRSGIKFISDFEGQEPSMYGGIKNVPVTILGKDKMPIIEYLVGNGKKNEEIIDYLKKEISKNKISSFYCHGLFELRFKLRVLEEIFKFIWDGKIKSKRLIDY